ncbi:hypothetical protein [Shewanella sp. YIC-542]|uniref:hypothetical protein n=1 Tax=Shewanella mytili TaxID=3377111 RepID=UPI00398F1262
MLFKSLICFQGCDQGWRHLVIALLGYALLLLLWLLLGHGYFIWLPGLLLAAVMLASALRRVRDAGRPLLMALPALLPWLLVLAALSASDGRIYLMMGLLLAGLLHLGLAFLPGPANKGAVNRRTYDYGYWGPVARVAQMKHHVKSHRVEPTMGGADGMPMKPAEEGTPLCQAQSPAAAFSAQSTDETADETADDMVQGHVDDNGRDAALGESVWRDEPQLGSLSAMLGGWRDALIELQQQAWQYRKLLGGFAAVLLVLVVGLVWWLSPQTPADKLPAPAQSAPQTGHPADTITVKLPDNFSLSLRQDVLSLSWLGDSLQPGSIWTLATAKGDKRCAQLLFNDGSQFRPMTVNIVNANGQVEAVFSPLDTQAVIQNVAMRGSIKLCGYDFSLKGSLAVLQSDAAFSRYLE